MALVTYNGLYDLAENNRAAFSIGLCGIIPHQGQAHLMDCKARDITAVCGRRWGKTTAEAVKTICWSLCNPDTQTWIIAPTQDQANIIFNMMIRALNGPLNVLVAKVTMSPFPCIVFTNGALVHARSCGHDGMYLRGHHADRIILDEAAFLPTAVVQDVVPKMLATSRYRIIERLSTPFGKNHFWEAYNFGAIDKADDPDFAVFHYPSWTSPYVDRDYLEEEFHGRSRLSFAVEYGAIFRDDQAAMFPWKYVSQCISDDLSVRFGKEGALHGVDPIAGHEYVMGFDPARAGDRSAICVIDKSATPFEVVYLQDLGGRSYGIQEEMCAHISERYNNAPVKIDATKHDQLAERLESDDIGLTVYPHVFTNENKWELAEAAAVSFEHTEVALPRHPDFLREIQYYEMKKRPSGLPKLGAPESDKHHDDYVTAYMLALDLARYQEPEVTVDWAQF